MFFSKPVLAFRVLGRRGNYPSFSLRTTTHAFVPTPDLVWSAAIQHPLGENWEKGEVGTFLPEEIRLLSAVCLSERDPFVNGALGLQLCYGAQIDLSEVPYGLDDPRFDEFARQTAEQLRQDYERQDWHPTYSTTQISLSGAGSRDDALQILNAIDPENQLLLAGLNRLLGSLRLRSDGYLEEAFVLSTISLGVAMEYVRLCLQVIDSENRSFGDVYSYFRETFPFGDPFPEFLEWMYELRVIAIHPASRFGVHWSPGLMVGMVYELQNWLKVIYRHLLLDEIPEGPEGSPAAAV